MEQQNFLGIYLSKRKVTAVLLSGKGAEPVVKGCFNVSIEQGTDNQDQSKSLGLAVAQNLAEKNLKLDDATVAVDCAMYIQHDLHSEFTDPKQISQTIRFDAEEAVATDATELAITFSVTGTDKNGSNISVFTARRELLTEILNDLQHNNLDPTAMEPDIICLGRFLQHNFNVTEDSNPLFVIFSQQSCYMININPEKSQYAPFIRSFLANPSQNKTTVLTNQLPTTLALHSSRSPDKPITSLHIACESNDIDTRILAERFNLEAHIMDLDQLTNIDPSLLTDLAAKSDFAIAYGAALGELIKARKNDFRQDFFPYQGKKLALQKTLRFLSVSLTILMLAVGIYFQSKVFMKHKYINQLQQKAKEDYSKVMFGKSYTSKEPIASILKRVYNRVVKIKSGLSSGDDESVTARLTFIFEAINQAPGNIDLKINTITVTSKTMNMAGDTKGRKSTLSLLNSLKKHPKLKVSAQNLKQAGNRDTFILTLESK